ncbi:MAG TPA: amidohydrolase family protein [Blastocatellia bacterium]|nr:amidohydrolase family protein [Blastocatellia bacterium]
MDRPLPAQKTLLPARLRRNLMAGALLTAVVFLVGALPLAFLYFYARDSRQENELANGGGIERIASPAPQVTASSVVAFINVNIVPMDAERVIKGQTLIVRGDRITEIGPAEQVKVPAGALRVDGAGKYLIPGLVDMHVHLRNYSEQDTATLLRLYVCNGVTTVLNLSGAPRHLELRARVAKGELFGPTIYTSGPFISASPNPPPSPAEIEADVVAQKRAGYDLIKIHGDFTREGYRKLFEVARREKMRVVGHSPRNLGYEVMSEERQDAVAHAEEYIYDRQGSSGKFAEIEAKIPAIAQATAQAGTWLIPNLTAYKNIGEQAIDINAVFNRPEMRYLPPAIAEQWGPASNPYHARFRHLPADSFWARYRVLEKLTKGFRDAGVRLLAGTDAMNPSVVPGFSLHDELRDLVAAGLTPYEALRAATANAAEFLGATAEFGTVTIGRRADLALVEADPLKGVGNAAKRAGVMLRGRWLVGEELRQMLVKSEDKK